MTEPPFVKRGQTITATLWNQLCSAVRACRIIAGDGVRLREIIEMPANNLSLVFER